MAGVEGEGSAVDTVSLWYDLCGTMSISVKCLEAQFFSLQALLTNILRVQIQNCLCSILELERVIKQ